MAARWLQRWLEETRAPAIDDEAMVAECLVALGGERHAHSLSYLHGDRLAPLTKRMSPGGAQAGRVLRQKTLDKNGSISESRIPVSKQFVLGVDLDGVVGDFYGFMRIVAAEWREVPESSLTTNVSYGLPEWGITNYEDMHRFAVTQRQLFRKMQLIDGAASTLRRLSDNGIHIRVITHRLFISHFHREAVQQTVDWLDNYGIPYRDICFTGEKVAVGADLYIEDTPHNVRALREVAPTIVFSNSTNRDVEPPRADTWEQVEELVLAEKARWEQESAAATIDVSGH